jgi:hypothetical protein
MVFFIYRTAGMGTSIHMRTASVRYGLNLQAICYVLPFFTHTNLSNQYDGWQQTRVIKPEKQRQNVLKGRV